MISKTIMHGKSSKTSMSSNDDKTIRAVSMVRCKHSVAIVRAERRQQGQSAVFCNVNLALSK